jgi:hypothetical protein
MVFWIRAGRLALFFPLITLKVTPRMFKFRNEGSAETDSALDGVDLEHGADLLLLHS